MKYLKVFETENLQNEFRAGEDYIQPHVSCLEDGNKVKYNIYTKEEQIYLSQPFTIEALDTGNISWALENKTVQYSKNGGAWETMTKDTTISVVEGDEVQFKGTNANYNNNKFSSTARFNAKGNIMSLTDGDEFESADTINEYAFSQLFDSCDTIVSAKHLKLPIRSLAESCYDCMFRYCTSLTTAPELPATILASYCYANMFIMCTSLTTAPELPATTLADSCYTAMFKSANLTTAPKLPATTLVDGCYWQMFCYCASLTTAPELPATTLADSCYRQMFGFCTGLTTAPELPATTLADSCYRQMFYSCTNLVTAPELPATTLAGNCYNAMFRGCTSLTTAPELPAQILIENCYAYMFRECTNLTTVPKLPAMTLSAYCYSGMFMNCSNLVTAPELPAIELVANCYDNMFYSCSSLNYIKAMFTTTPSSGITTYWVNGVASAGTFVKNSAATWNVTGVNGVPTGWTVETASS